MHLSHIEVAISGLFAHPSILSTTSQYLDTLWLNSLNFALSGEAKDIVAAGGHQYEIYILSQGRAPLFPQTPALR